MNAYFMEREYQRIPTDSETVRMYANKKKSSLYLINVIALDAEYAFDLAGYNAYKALTKKQFEGTQADKTILLNLILMENPSRIYKYVNVDPELEEDFIDIHWLIGTDKNELIIPSKQIKNILGLEKEIIGIIDAKEMNLIKLPKVERLPLLTVALVLINCIIWVVLEATGGSYDGSNLVRFGALYAPLILENNEYYRILTSNYLHMGATHLFFNCFSLYIFGSRLEKYISRVQFFMIYTGAGLMGSLLSLVSHLVFENNAISVGASGAIYGLIGCIIVCSKLTGKEIEDLNAYMMGIFFILGIAFSTISPNVDTSAHLGGFLGGLLLTIILLSKPKKIKSVDSTLE